MTAETFRQLLDALGLTQRAAARFLGVNEKTMRDWCDTRRGGPPAPVAKLVCYMHAAGLDAEAIERQLIRRAAEGGRSMPFRAGQRVRKRRGYAFPGVVVAAYLTLAGEPRFVVECTVEGVAGCQHIFSPDQLQADDG